MDVDFYNDKNLGRLGGNKEAANKFRGIDDDLREYPSVSHWFIAARRKNGIWGIYALLKVRQSTAEEKRAPGIFDKYLYYDEVESGFLALPGEVPLANDRIDLAIKQKIVGQTQGRNGTLIQIAEDVIAEVRQNIKLTIRSRKEELRKDAWKKQGATLTAVNRYSSGDDDNPEGSTESSSLGEPIEIRTPDAGKDLDASIPNDAKQDPVIPDDAQASLESETRSLTTAEREAVVKVRYGQGAFREALLKVAGEKCWMSGIEGKRLLVASHIKPWSHCENSTDSSRGQPDNGLLLSALWDNAFDAGLISFDPDFRVVTSSELSESAKRALVLGKHSALPEKFRTHGRRDLLAYHRTAVFECWKKTAG